MPNCITSKTDTIQIYDENHRFDYDSYYETDGQISIAEENCISPNQLTFSGLESTRYTAPIKLESRRYIGNKAKLVDWIMNLIDEHTENVHSFCDIFSGTGAVSNRAIHKYNHVIMNDFLFSNNVIYKAFFGTGYWDRNKLCDLLDKYNAINLETIEDNYFSNNFGGKYFDINTSKLIGFIRQDIEDHKNCLTEKEYNILLASLIYNIDRIANTVGHFDAYIKKKIKPQKLFLRLIEANSYPNVSIYRQDANLLSRDVYADITYMDPPYNSRQYCRFYHLYETLIKWDKPKLFGVALKPKPENMSSYCTAKAVDCFEDLVRNLNTRYIVVSYNNTYNSKSKSSENKIKLEDIEDLLNRCGKTKKYERSYAFFNAGKTNLEDHKEFVFITKVDNEKRSKSFTPIIRW